MRQIALAADGAVCHDDIDEDGNLNLSAEEFQQQPDAIEIRLVDMIFDRAGFRSDKFTVATTFTSSVEVRADWIRSVYESRWLVELDIRAVKCSLHMDILRAKTPPMVLTELLSCLLAYNLVRLKMLQSSMAQRRASRSLSFTTAQQLLATNWLLCAIIGVTEEKGFIEGSDARGLS